MNALIHIAALVGLGWLAYFFFNTVSNAFLGFVCIGLWLLFLAYTVQAFADDLHDIGSVNHRRGRGKGRSRR